MAVRRMRHDRRRNRRHQIVLVVEGQEAILTRPLLQSTKYWLHFFAGGRLRSVDEVLDFCRLVG